MIEFVSPAANGVLGRTPTDLVGTPWAEMGADADRDVLRSVVAGLIFDPAVSVPFRYTTRHCDGTWRVMQAIGTNLLEHPDVQAFVVNQRDATAEQSALSRFESFLAVAPDAMLIADAEGRVLTSNGRARSLFGSELSAKPIDKLLPTLRGRWSELIEHGSYSS